jgi:hypothetical protein
VLWWLWSVPRLRITGNIYGIDDAYFVMLYPYLWVLLWPMLWRYINLSRQNAWLGSILRTPDDLYSLTNNAQWMTSQRKKP